MKYLERGMSTSTVTYLDSPASNLCTCLPLSRLHQGAWEDHEENPEQLTEVTPATLEINSSLRALLENYFPRSTPLSVLLLHVSQLEHIHIAPKSSILHKRLRYHAPASLLKQILINMRRTIRSCDDRCSNRRRAGVRSECARGFNAVIWPCLCQRQRTAQYRNCLC